MKDELTINGKLYIHTPEIEKKKEPRNQCYIVDSAIYLLMQGKTSRNVLASYEKLIDSDILMVELKENEIIVSEDDIINAFKKSGYNTLIGYPESLLKNLFKKDGV